MYEYIAYIGETYRRMDEIKEAENSRLAAECCKSEKSNFSKYILNLLAALVMFFVKHRV